MREYLNGIAPDYNAYFTTQTSGVDMPQAGEFTGQAIDLFDDNSEERIYYSTTPQFLVSLPFNDMTESEINTVMDFYFDASKANGTERSFLWTHPSTNEIYVVKFNSKFNYTINYQNYHSLSGVILKVLGRYGAVAITSDIIKVSDNAIGNIIYTLELTAKDIVNFRDESLQDKYIQIEMVSSDSLKMSDRAEASVIIPIRTFAEDILKTHSVSTGNAVTPILVYGTDLIEMADNSNEVLAQLVRANDQFTLRDITSQQKLIGYSNDLFALSDTSSMTLTDFVSWYDFETLTTDSKGLNTLTNAGDVVQTTAIKFYGNTSAQFNGYSNSYLERTDTNLSSDFPLKSGTTNTTFSITFWMRADVNTGTYAQIINKYGTTGNLRSFAITLDWSANRFQFVQGHTLGATAESANLPGTVERDIWYHVAITYNGSNDNYFMKVWDNKNYTTLGTMADSFTNSIYISTAPFRIGTNNDGNYDFEGFIDDVRIFNNKILTETEIDSIRNEYPLYDYYNSGTNWYAISYDQERTYTGYRMISDDAIELQKVSFYCEELQGTQSSYDWYCRIFDLVDPDSADYDLDLTSILGTSELIEGQDLLENEGFTFHFSTTASIPASTEVGVAIYRVATGDGPDGTKVYSSTDRLYVARDEDAGSGYLTNSNINQTANAGWEADGNRYIGDSDDIIRTKIYATT